MTKIWINKEKREDVIIAIDNEIIYKANPKENKIPEYIENIENNVISNNILSIPFSYIKTIQLQEGKKYIQVFFGQESEERIRINDSTKRKEIFKYFKEIIPESDYKFEKYSALKSAKKPLIALTLIALLFAWTLYLSIQIEMGYEYELIGSARSITAIVLVLANLGILNVILIFGALFGIGTYATIRKIKNRPVIHEIKVN